MFAGNVSLTVTVTSFITAETLDGLFNIGVILYVTSYSFLFQFLRYASEHCQNPNFQTAQAFTAYQNAL